MAGSLNEGELIETISFGPMVINFRSGSKKLFCPTTEICVNKLVLFLGQGAKLLLLFFWNRKTE